MRDYGKVAPQFWTGPTGRVIRDAGQDCQITALYLITSQHANMVGIYFVPINYISYETGIPGDRVKAALDRLGEIGFSKYDHATETVWVRQFARFQVGEKLKPLDKRCAGVERELRRTQSPFVGDFIDEYRDDFHLKLEAPSKGRNNPFEGAYSPLRSQEQEQEQIPPTPKGGDERISIPISSEATPVAPRTPKTPPQFDRDVMAAWDEFEAVYQQARPGAMPMKFAFHATAFADAIREFGRADLLEAWRWAWLSPSAKAIAVREKWHGMDTLCRNAAKYIEQSQAPDAWKAAPTNASPTQQSPSRPEYVRLSDADKRQIDADARELARIRQERTKFEAFKAAGKHAQTA